MKGTQDLSLHYSLQLCVNLQRSQHKQFNKKLYFSPERTDFTLSKCILFIGEGQSQGSALWERHLSSSCTWRPTITLRQVQKYTHQ